MILKIIGHPSDEDLSFISSPQGIEYVNNISNPKEKSKLELIFPDTDPELLRLLKGLLEFNPYHRLTAQEALKSKAFDHFRSTVLEQPSGKAVK